MKTTTLGLILTGWLGSAAIAAPFASSIKGDLVALKGKRTSKFDDAALAQGKYFAVYFSASWCGPCKAFTPDLVKWYNQFKPAHPEFELILASRDQDEPSMEAYMAADQMPWPALKFSKVRTTKSIEALAGRGIPCLVLVDADGKVLSHSYEDGKYVGPRKVLADIEKTLGAGSAPATSTTAAPGAAAPATPAPPAAYKPAGSTFDEFFKKKTQ